MAKDREQFDDPEMKSLLHKAWGHEKAPEALRARVAATLADASRPETKRSSPVWIRYAAAALVLLAIGYGYMAWQQHQLENQPTVITYTLPANLKGAMVDLHKTDPATMDQSSVAGLTDINQIDDKLTAALGKPVLATNLEGWKFIGAGIARVADQPTARLVFTKGGVTASIFSVIAPPGYAATDGTRYDELHQNVAIAGVVKNGMIYCILASPGDEKQLEAVKDLREQISGKI